MVRYLPSRILSALSLEGYITKKGDIRPARSKIEAVGQGGAPGLTGGAGQGSLGRCSQAARRPGQPCLTGERQKADGNLRTHPRLCGDPRARNASGFTALPFEGAPPALREATPVHRYLLALHA